MTREEFGATQWGKHTMVIYEGEERTIQRLCFEEDLLNLNPIDIQGEIDVVRCESVELVE